MRRSLLPSAPYLPSATSPLLQWRRREPPSFYCCYVRAATRHQNLREKEREVVVVPPVAPSSAICTCIIWRGLLLFLPLPLCDCTSCTKQRERETGQRSRRSLLLLLFLSTLVIAHPFTKRICTKCHLEHHLFISCEAYKECKEDPDATLLEWGKGEEQL
jgi:hypothetical protein